MIYIRGLMASDCKQFHSFIGSRTVGECVRLCLCVCFLIRKTNNIDDEVEWMKAATGRTFANFLFVERCGVYPFHSVIPFIVSTWRNENFSNSIFSQIVRQMKRKSTSERALSSFRCRLSFLCVVAALFFSHSHTQWEMNAGVAAEEERKKLITAHRRWDR